MQNTNVCIEFFIFRPFGALSRAGKWSFSGALRACARHVRAHVPRTCAGRVLCPYVWPGLVRSSVHVLARRGFAPVKSSRGNLRPLRPWPFSGLVARHLRKSGEILSFVLGALEGLKRARFAGASVVRPCPGKDSQDF